MALAPSLAPGCADLGVMLPYSPLHHLLLGDFAAPLVMTSGNVSDEPIAFDDAVAIVDPLAIADLQPLAAALSGAGTAGIGTGCASSASTRTSRSGSPRSCAGSSSARSRAR